MGTTKATGRPKPLTGNSTVKGNVWAKGGKMPKKKCVKKCK